MLLREKMLARMQNKTQAVAAVEEEASPEARAPRPVMRRQASHVTDPGAFPCARALFLCVSPEILLRCCVDP